MIEVWKDIEGYEGLYQVSNLGNVRSLDRIVDYGHSKAYRKGKNLSGSYASGGYAQVQLNHNKKTKQELIHRLVAKAFIPNPNNLPCVNHKDENKRNNCVENLEWCTEKENINYGTRTVRRTKTVSVPVVMCDLDGAGIMEFDSVNEAARKIHSINIAGNITECCKGRRKTACGYKWKYKDS